MPYVNTLGILNKKNLYAPAFGIRYLSAFWATPPRQLSPAEKLQHRESRPRLSVFFLPYPEARPPGFPYRSQPSRPSRGFGARYPAPPLFFLKKEKRYNHYITIRK